MGTVDFAARGGPAVISIVSVRNSIFIPFEVLGLLTTEGADLVREVGYVPLTDQEYTIVQRRVDDRTTGTMYGHGDELASLETLLGGAEH